MTFIEKTTDHRKLRRWEGNIEADYYYTSGLAGERFFTELKATGKFLATHCTRCDLTYLPPRMYCEQCLAELRDWKQIPMEGKVETFTTARIDEEGKPLAEPQVWALVRFPDINGGFVHRIIAPPEKVKAGIRVRPRLKPELLRTGEVTDIEGFEPIPD